MKNQESHPQSRRVETRLEHCGICDVNTITKIEDLDLSARVCDECARLLCSAQLLLLAHAGAVPPPPGFRRCGPDVPSESFFAGLGRLQAKLTAVRRRLEQIRLVTPMAAHEEIATLKDLEELARDVAELGRRAGL